MPGCTVHHAGVQASCLLFVKIFATSILAVKFSGTSWEKREWPVVLLERYDGCPISGLPWSTATLCSENVILCSNIAS